LPDELKVILVPKGIGIALSRHVKLRANSFLLKKISLLLRAGICCISILVLASSTGEAESDQLTEARAQSFQTLYRARFGNHPLLATTRPLTQADFDRGWNAVAQLKKVILFNAAYLQGSLEDEEFRASPDFKLDTAETVRTLAQSMPCYFQSQIELTIAAKIWQGSRFDAKEALALLERNQLSLPFEAAEFLREINFDSDQKFGVGNFNDAGDLEDQALKYVNHVDSGTKVKSVSVALSSRALMVIDRKALTELNLMAMSAPDADKAFLDFLKLETLHQLSAQSTELRLQLNDPKLLPIIPETLRRQYLSLNYNENPGDLIKAKNEGLLRDGLTVLVAQEFKEKLSKQEIEIAQSSIAHFNDRYLEVTSEVFRDVFFSKLDRKYLSNQDWVKSLDAMFQRVRNSVEKNSDSLILSYARDILKNAKYADQLEAYVHPAPPSIVYSSYPVIVPQDQWAKWVPRRPEVTYPLDPFFAIKAKVDKIGKKRPKVFTELEKLLEWTFKDAEEAGKLSYISAGYSWKKKIAELVDIPLFDCKFADWTEESVRDLAKNNKKISESAQKNRDKYKGKYSTEMLDGLPSVSGVSKEYLEAVVEFFRIGKKFRFESIDPGHVAGVMAVEKLSELNIDSKTEFGELKIPTADELFDSIAERTEYYDLILREEIYQNYPLLTEKIRDGKTGRELLVQLKDDDVKGAQGIAKEYAAIAWNRLQRLITDIGEASSPETVAFVANTQLLETIGASYPKFAHSIEKLLRKVGRAGVLDRMVSKYVHLPMLATLLPVLYKLSRKLIFKRVTFVFDAILINSFVDGMVGVATVAMLPLMKYDWEKLKKTENMVQRQEDWFYSTLRTMNGSNYVGVEAARGDLSFQRFMFKLNAVLNTLLVFEIPGVIRAFKAQTKTLATFVSRLHSRGQMDPKLRDIFDNIEKRVDALDIAMRELGMSQSSLNKVNRYYELWVHLAKSNPTVAKRLPKIREAWLYLRKYMDEVRASQAGAR